MQQEHFEIKKKMIDTCLILEKEGYFIGTWGNLSVRVPEGVIVTPSRIPYKEITLNDFVTLDDDGRVISGHRLPTSEAEIHSILYRKKSDIGAAIHGHSVYATAVSCLNRAIPVFVEEIAQLIGGEIRCTRYVPAGQHKNIAKEVAATIGEVNAVLVANHGSVCCGRTLEEAFVACQVLEKAALMLLVSAPLGSVIPIPEEYVQSERHRFLYKYGTPKTDLNREKRI